MDHVYSPELARLHHAEFADVGRAAARELLYHLGAGPASAPVVELGVGSGASSRVLLAAGHRVVGVDLSPTMLELAREHGPEGEYRRGSAWTVELPTAAAVTGFGEVFSYCSAGVEPSLDLLRQRLSDVHRCLEPGGLLLFDAPVPMEPDETRGVRHEVDGVLLCMEESFEDGVVVRTIDTFVAEPDGRYRRVAEEHRLVPFSPSDLVQVAGEAGFRGVQALDGYDDHPFDGGWVAVLGRA